MDYDQFGMLCSYQVTKSLSHKTEGKFQGKSYLDIASLSL